MSHTRGLSKPPPAPLVGDEPLTPRTGLRDDAVWALLLAGVVCLIAVTPILIDPWYYYKADTSEGAYGIWYHLGSEISAGRWPLLNPSAWMSGNYAAEGQWGLFSPITIGIGLLSVHAGNVVAFSSAVKILFLAVGACGTYMLARNYAARVPWAFVAGTAAPFSGFTMYMDAPSWVTNLIVWSLLPWAWLGVRRYAAGLSAWLALGGAYLIISIGYVHGTLMLFAVLLGLLAEALLTKSLAVRRIVWIGIFSALVTVTVFLPGFLSVGVTNRTASGIGNDGFMVADLTGLVSSILPSSLPQVTGWWGDFAAGPVLYTAWFLPMFVFLAGTKDSAGLRRLAGPFVVLAVTTAFILGPSVIGPLRFPTRLMPFFVLALLLVWAVTMSQRAGTHVPVGRMLIAQGLIGVAMYLSISQAPQTWIWQVLFGSMVSLVTWVVWALLNRSSSDLKSVALVMVLATGTFVGIQHLVFDGTQTSSTWRFPTQLADYQSQLQSGVGDAVVVGVVPEPDPSVVPVSLVANQWYLNPHVASQNLYTTIQFRGYSELVCMDHRGSTCPELLPRLFAPVADLGIPLADALSVSTIQVLGGPTGVELPSPWPPRGWDAVVEDPQQLVLTRKVPRAAAGGVVAEQGASVTVTESAADSVRFRVDSVAPQGGVVTFSRLAWPGYTVSGGGETADPAGGFLQTVKVSPQDRGAELTLSFRPPGWHLELAALGLALVVAMVLIVEQAMITRRKARYSTAPSSVL